MERGPLNVPGSAVVAREPFRFFTVVRETHLPWIPLDDFVIVVLLIQQVTAYGAASTDFFIGDRLRAHSHTVQEGPNMIRALVESNFDIFQEILIDAENGGFKGAAGSSFTKKISRATFSSNSRLQCAVEATTTMTTKSCLLWRFMAHCGERRSCVRRVFAGCCALWRFMTTYR